MASAMLQGLPIKRGKPRQEVACRIQMQEGDVVLSHQGNH